MNGIRIIIAFVCGFIVAQMFKFVIGFCTGENNKNIKDFRTFVTYLVRSGGMPSGHSASFIAATTCIGLSEGFSSVLFAISVCMTAIILYDAVNVRYVVGEQGKILNKMIPKPISIAEGHTILEVFCGGLLGILIGLFVFWLF